MGKKALSAIILGAFAALALVVISARSLREGRHTQSTTDSSPAPPTKAIPSEASDHQTRGTPIDLLPLIDLNTHVIAGDWSYADGRIIAPAFRFARVEIPYAPPQNYDLEVVAMRTSGSSSLAIGLVVKGRQCAAILDGWDPVRSGLDLINGNGFWRNETTHEGSVIATGEPTTIIASVRDDSVTISVEKIPVVTWTGDPKQLTLFSNWRVSNTRCLFLGTWESQFMVTSIRLIPIAGSGELLR